MTVVFTEIFVLLLLLVANGVFAMTEIAIVSARKPRLRRLAEQGDSRARTALELAESPNRFLSTVQLGIALVMARFMHRLSVLTAPLITFLSKSTELLLRLFGVKLRAEAAVTEDEVRRLMQEGLRAGAFSKVESHIIHSALDLDQLTVRDLMAPRPKIIWINKNDPHDVIWRKIVVSGHSHFPVYEGQRDNVVGIVSVKSIYANLAAGLPARTADLMTEPRIVPSTQTAIQLLDSFKQSGKHLALVTDEFGSIVGLVALHDVMEALVGEFPSFEERARPEIRRREDGSWLIDAMIEIERVEAELPGFRLSAAQNKDFQTLAGFVVKALGRVPREGEIVEAQGYVFEILDMDGHRVDKVLALKSQRPAKSNRATEGGSRLGGIPVRASG